MLERKTAAKAAKSVFFEDFNDIDIYIEDTAEGYKKIFKELLKKTFGEDLKIDQIFPVGSRKEVINVCSANQENGRRKRVYIIDGDLFLLHNDESTDLKGLFILPRYCIENYLIQEQPIVDILYQESPEKDKNELKDILKFDNWLEFNNQTLTELFKIYSLCKKIIPEEKTVSYIVSKLCNDNSGNICKSKTNDRIDFLKQKLIDEIGLDNFQIEYDSLTNNIDATSFEMLKYVSGKDYLIPLIFKRLRSMIRTRIDNITLKIRLSEKCEILELAEIPNYVIE